MGVKVATTSLHWSQPIIHPSPSSSQTIASAISPFSRRRIRCEGRALVFKYVKRLDRSALFGTSLTNLHKSSSCEISTQSRAKNLNRACSANLNDFSDEEFSRKLQDLARRLQFADVDDEEENSNSRVSYSADNHGVSNADSNNRFSEKISTTSEIDRIINFVEKPASKLDSVETSRPDFRLEPPLWPERDEIIPASIERKANSVDLPLSLRIIKRKKQWQEGFQEAGESAYCSVKKAFSSMVFIIREVHSFTLQMREFLCYEDFQEILARVQKEMHASFVWLFQQVFSHTPTLMVYVMILLANFTVYSMGNNAAIAAASSSPGTYSAITETSSVLGIHQEQNHQKIDSSAIKTFSVSSSTGKTTSIGGNNGGGGKIRPVSSGTDGDGLSDRSDQYQTILPDGASELSSLGMSGEAELVSGQVTEEEELNLWNSFLEEASRMQLTDEVLDHEIMQKLVSPVNAKIEADDYVGYFRTELLYQEALSKEPNNALLLANFAQFLYLVAQDYDRAEEYFKKATAVEPPEAEAFSKYATFLWRAREDLWAAEETYLEAISVDPSNSFYAADYAHFLWNTGGEDTCFPLNSPDTTQDA